MKRTHSINAASIIAVVFAIALIATSCGSDGSTAVAAQAADSVCGSTDVPSVVPATQDTGTKADTTIRLATHDSFALSPETLEAFTAETGITVDVVSVGDAGQLVSTAVLSKDNPTADVLFGIDNAFLCRGLNAGIFAPYTSPNLAALDQDLVLDDVHRVTPISYGDVCVNYWRDAVPSEPTSLNDLTDAAFDGAFVTMDPETSSPGFAFLLATISAFGDTWPQYWQGLADNNVAITSGWSDAYYGEFTAGGGDRGVVTSYASSPPAEVIFADPPVDVPPTGVIADSCFRQIEFAGILAGTSQPTAAAKLIDFMLTPQYQEDIPMNMFVYPAHPGAALPEAFVEHTVDVANPLTIDPADIEANRDAWTAEWREIVLG